MNDSSDWLLKKQVSLDGKKISHCQSQEFKFLLQCSSLSCQEFLPGANFTKRLKPVLGLKSNTKCQLAKP